MRDKATVIADIQQVNRSARSEWLEEFDVAALQLYLDHLRHAQQPRGGQSRWRRPGDTPAVIDYTPPLDRSRFNS